MSDDSKVRNNVPRTPAQLRNCIRATQKEISRINKLIKLHQQLKEKGTELELAHDRLYAIVCPL